MSSVFLFFVFFFPRLTLLLVWLFGTIPANDTSFVLDVIGAIFAPRLLVGWWLYVAGAHPLLIILFVLAGLSELFGGGSSVSTSSESGSNTKRKRR